MSSKTAATRIGCTAEEYERRRAAGLRWCGRCRSWREPYSGAYCRDCFNSYRRERYVFKRAEEADQEYAPPWREWVVVGDELDYGSFDTEAEALAEVERLRRMLHRPPGVPAGGAVHGRRVTMGRDDWSDRAWEFAAGLWLLLADSPHLSPTSWRLSPRLLALRLAAWEWRGERDREYPTDV